MKIEKCPFCDKDVAEISNCRELLESCPATEPYVCVVCNMHEGGCGASSGYYDSAEKAIAAWNRRANTENKPLMLDEIISRCTPKAAELLKSGQLGAIKVCAVSESIHPTNADRIRSMSDGELAEFLRNIRDCGDYEELKFIGGVCMDYVSVIEWLKQPLKEE